MTTLERSSLGSLRLLGSGGQGSVYHAPKARISFAAAAAFKEYKPEWRARVDFGALEAMTVFLEEQTFAEGSRLVERIAWPARLVANAGSPVGFLMPEVPADFRTSLRLPSGATEQRLADLQLLLNPEAYLARVGLAVCERDRYLLAAEVAESLAILHGHGIAVGDLSPKNVLFSLDPAPRCFFVDADAMALPGRSALPQAETPDWEIRSVSGEELATPASDSYKLGLLVLRLLAGDQSTRDPGSLPRSAPADIRDLLVRSLPANPAARPAPSSWVAPLRAAAASANTALPVPARSAPAQAPPTPTPPPRPAAPAPVAPAPQPAPAARVQAHQATTLPAPRPATQALARPPVRNTPPPARASAERRLVPIVSAVGATALGLAGGILPAASVNLSVYGGSGDVSVSGFSAVASWVMYLGIGSVVLASASRLWGRAWLAGSLLCLCGGAAFGWAAWQIFGDVNQAAILSFGPGFWALLAAAVCSILSAVLRGRTS